MFGRPRELLKLAPLGYGVLTQEFANQYLQRDDLVLLNKGKFMEHRLALAWYKRPTMPPWFEKVLSVIK